jgi:hypothetical protein
VQSVVPGPEIASVLRAGYVALAADCDAAEPEVERLAAGLPDAMTLPFVLLADAQGNFLGGSAGAQSPKALESLLRTHAPAPRG